ncbi:MAG: hypothetical protein A2558_10580 [Tenericutes bacterium RIFOXYD2_FULL_35_11]|nr:MAG: hypothetical protein A2558_10580 [Tenericutes bacterium RIFOXYD2_FULL_35_11]
MRNRNNLRTSMAQEILDEMPLPNDLPMTVRRAAELGHVFQYVGSAWSCIWCEAEIQRVEREDRVYFNSNAEALAPCPELAPATQSNIHRDERDQ